MEAPAEPNSGLFLCAATLALPHSLHHLTNLREALALVLDFRTHFIIQPAVFFILFSSCTERFRELVNLFVSTLSGRLQELGNPRV